jgi:NAD(P)H-quinone oxidoreductase subunit 5
MQFVRAPSLLHDYHTLENAVGEHLPRAGGPLARLRPGGFRLRLYRFCLERGYLDAVLSAYVVGPFVRAFRCFDRVERWWTGLLAGRPGPATGAKGAAAERIEDLS